MAFMTNSIIKYDTIERDNYIYTDVTGLKYYNLVTYNIPSEYLDILTLENDTRLEYESYKLYKTENYWDLLLCINNLIPLFGLPKKYDLIETYALELLANYQNETRLTLSTKVYKEFYDKTLQRLIIENEKNRKIKIIKPERMQDFIKLLREEGLI